MKIKYDEPDCAFIEKGAHMENLVNGDQWFYFPFWMKKLGNGVFECVTFDKLPEDLINKIKETYNPTVIDKLEDLT